MPPAGGVPTGVFGSLACGFDVWAFTALPPGVWPQTAERVAVIEAGARTVNIPDTVGYAYPNDYADLITYLRANVKDIDKAVISVHCHNDLGLAVANSLAAVEAGIIKQVWKVPGRYEVIAVVVVESVAQIDPLTHALPFFRLGYDYCADFQWTMLGSYADWATQLDELMAS